MAKKLINKQKRIIAPAVPDSSVHATGDFSAVSGNQCTGRNDHHRSVCGNELVERAAAGQNQIRIREPARRQTLRRTPVFRHDAEKPEADRIRIHGRNRNRRFQRGDA